jgi:hypothetical protein
MFRIKKKKNWCKFFLAFFFTIFFNENAERSVAFGSYNNLAKPPYVLFVRSLSPPKLAGLAPKIFRRHTPKWLWNQDISIFDTQTVFWGRKYVNFILKLVIF